MGFIIHRGRNSYLILLWSYYGRHTHATHATHAKVIFLDSWVEIGNKVEKEKVTSKDTDGAQKIPTIYLNEGK